jgi:hypothetical protein
VISILQPTITIQKVSNGWFIQWYKPSPDKTVKLTLVEAVATNMDDFFKLVEIASQDIESTKK